MTEATKSRAFEHFHPKVQRWIWEQNWTELRDAQEASADVILEGNRDVIIASATASGKTEAAFLPIASRLASETTAKGLVLYISPLKALINDQFLRLEPFFKLLELPAHPLHGDVAASKKNDFVKSPQGILLITPESLEGIFVRRGTYIHSIFANLRYSVVDEVHAFVGSERGKQVQSLLARLETAIRRTVPRIGLSATLGDMGLAAEFLRPGAGERVCTVVSETTGQEIKLVVQGYEETDKPSSVRPKDEEQTEVDNAEIAIADDIFKQLRGSSNLVFANSRANVELYADMLRQQCHSKRYRTSSGRITVVFRRISARLRRLH